MCGICGAVDGRMAGAAEASLRRMLPALRHRGPDDEGIGTEPPLAFGMRRLSIIDLSGGHQPIHNEDGSVAVVNNGEIYNFRALRAQLESLGHVFRTQSDTEVIVHAYEQWGRDCVHHLRGMFAFALYDGRGAGGGGGAGHLLLARDRLGIKPLYYASRDGVFVFASEVRALLATGVVPRRLSLPALEGYLTFGSVPEPMSLVAGVFSLPPGHRLNLPLGRPAGEVRPERYWDLAAACRAGDGAGHPDRDRALRELREILDETIALHLIADVPLGIFLSSGIDSTALAALASRQQAGVHTFTVVFPEQEFSEAAVARRTARRFGTRHEELLVGGDEMLGEIDAAVAAFDQPSLDGINSYFVSQAASRVGLKVALSGLGGDEVFGGYDTFRSTPRLQALGALGRLLPAGARQVLAPALTAVARRALGEDPGRKLGAFWADAAALPHPYFFTRLLFPPRHVRALLGGAAAPRSSPWRDRLDAAAVAARELDPLAAVSYLEASSYLAGTLLRDTDALSMAHSLEVRVPLLDHRLAEYVVALPGKLKRRPGASKPLLVDALGEFLPDEVVDQRKRTFTFPWEHWLRGALAARMDAGFADLAPALEPAIDPNAFRSVWREFNAGRTSWSRPWSLFMLNEWAKLHLDPAS